MYAGGGFAPAREGEKCYALRNKRNVTHRCKQLELDWLCRLVRFDFEGSNMQVFGWILIRRYGWSIQQFGATRVSL